MDFLIKLETLGNITCIKADPGFAMVLALEYYDGPERGVASYSSGEGVRFSVLGESKSRCFRAFELHTIPGKWLDRMSSFRTDRSDANPCRVFVPERASAELTELENEVDEAAIINSYVCVGSPYFDWFIVSRVEKPCLEEIRRIAPSDGFQAVHKFIKAKLPQSSGNGRSLSGSTGIL